MEERAMMGGPDGDLFPLAGRRVWVAGHAGMVGSAVVRRLAGEGCGILTVPRRDLDLRRQAEVERWVAARRPDAIVLAAATVGGIADNAARPADFLYDNLAIQANVLDAARRAGVAKVLVLGSTCIYPRLAPQPISEDSLLTGPLEPTNQWYAIAKIAGVKLAQACRRQHGCDFVSAMPTNLYGPGDNFDPETAHVLPALMARMHRARAEGVCEIALWGSGRALREFLHVDDLADALVLLLRRYSGEAPVNVGSGEEVSIAGLASIVAEAVGWRGRILPDPSRPDGTPRKLADSSRLRVLGWKPRIGLRQGVEATYRWFLETGPGAVRGARAPARPLEVQA
jgi:GDP-L-fucose synthase